MKNCTGCKYACWNTAKSGRLHPSGDGRCNFPIKIPVLPQAFYWIGGNPSPLGGSINRHGELKEHCAYYEPSWPL